MNKLPVAEERGSLARLTYDNAGLLPAIVQDVDGTVLMLAWVNREAVLRTLRSGQTWFWSRSRQRLWHKGEESGNTQEVRGVWYDCDGDTLLVQVSQGGAGVACHTGARSCFYRRLTLDGDEAAATVAEVTQEQESEASDV